MFERWMSRILMAKAGEGGAGGSGGQGGDDGGEGDEALTKKINEVVHAALKGERKKIAKDVADELAPSFAEMVAKSVGDAFTGYEAKQAEKAKEGGAGGGQGGQGGQGGTGALSPEAEKRIKAAEEKAERAEKAQRDADEKRKAAETKALRDEERTQLVAGLTERGVRKALIGMAAKDLHERIVRDEKTNEIVFKIGDDEFDLAKGLDKYMESDAGKELLPPREVGGSGNRGGTGDRRGGKGEMTHEAFGAKFFGGKT